MGGEGGGFRLQRWPNRFYIKGDPRWMLANSCPKLFSRKEVFELARGLRLHLSFKTMDVLNGMASAMRQTKYPDNR